MYWRWLSEQRFDFLHQQLAFEEMQKRVLEVQARANSVEPQAYTADVIARVASDWPANRWDELMPWNWSPETARLAA